MEIEQQQQIADQPDDDGLADLEHVVVGAVDADAHEEQRARIEILGFVLGPRFEENFRRAMLISRGDVLVFVEHPISAVFVGLCVLLIVTQIYVRLRKPKALLTELELNADPNAAAQVEP